jgi:uncharacterized membrane protein
MIALLRLLHVLTAFRLVTGLIGRAVTLGRAEQSEDIGIAKALVETGGRFETLMVIPGSIAVLVLGLLTAFAQGLNFTAPGNRWLLWSLALFATIMVIIPTVFIPRGTRFEAALSDAVGSGSVTPDLKARFADPVTRASHVYELAAVVAIIVLMVTKPF